MGLCPGMVRYIGIADAFYAAAESASSVVEQRRLYTRLARRFTRARPAGLKAEDAHFPGPARGLDVPVRIYRPADLGAGPQPVLLYLHGGGFVVGSLDSHDCIVAELAVAAGAVAVSVDYRLAPEHPFPAALEDCQAVLAHLTGEGARELGLDARRVLIAGDSAGAALGLAATLVARERRRAMPVGLVFFYPALTAAANLPSYVENADAPMLTSEGLAWYWAHYTEQGRHAENPLASPLEADTFAGLPPVFIATAKFDPARDDGARLAERLDEEGQEVEYRCAEDLAHGYLRARAMSPSAAKEFVAGARAARRMLHGSEAPGQLRQSAEVG